MNVEELERARKIVTYDARAVANYSEALVGEVIARDWMTSTYKGRAKLRAVMVRPGGVPVLDYLFETGSGEFVVVEAKASKSQLGWTKGQILMVGPGGTLYPLQLPNTVQQFSPTWFEHRLEEMVGRNGDPASRRLAAELGRSWRAGQVRAVVIRAPEGARTTELAMEVVDYTEEWNAHVGATANHRIPPGTEVGSTVSGAKVRKGVADQPPPPVRTLAIHRADEKRLKKELGRIDDLRAKADLELKRAKGRLKAAERNNLAAERKAGTWQSTKDKLAAKVATEKADVAHLETKTATARKEVQGVKDELKELRQRITDTRAEVRKLYTSSGPSAPAPAADRPATGAYPDAPQLDQATNARATTLRGTDTAADATRARLATEAAATRTVAQGADAAKVGKLARVLSLSKTVGKVAIGLFVPLTKLEILLELALWLYDWDQRRRQADDREWARIYRFLFGSEEPFADPFSLRYLPAIGDSIWDAMNARLNNDRDSLNLLHWVRRWDGNPAWLGFVYVGISGDLMRQEHSPRVGSARKAPHPIRYWSHGLKYDFRGWSRESNREKKEGPTRELKPEHSENLFTLGKFGNPLNKEENKGPAPSGAAVELHSDYLYRDVEARKLAIRVTSPTPILTPFDYLLFKCKDLMTEILLFISKYDEYFLVTAPFTRETLFTSYVYQGVTFPKPIDDLGAHFCIGKLFDMIQLLESHTPLPQESAENGWERRRRIIAQVVPPNRTRDPRKDLSTRLHGLAGDLNYSTYRPDQDPDLAYLTNEYLSALADDIEKTARRMYNDMMKDRTSPRSFEYRYMGSKEV